jgi:hypothetical protein
MKSSIRMCTPRSKEAATTRATVVLPAPDGPVRMRMGAGTFCMAHGRRVVGVAVPGLRSIKEGRNP